ncbi:MAG: alpha/beta fold hydrolase [Bacillota bacterium]
MSKYHVLHDQINFEGKKIHIDIYPPKEKSTGSILFLHGNIVYGKVYAEFLSRLSNRGNFNVVSFDYLGWGRSEGIRGRTTAKDILGQIKEMVQYVKEKFPEKNIAVVGHSMGGHFAFEGLIDNPELKCCVCHTIRYPGTYANLIDRAFVNFYRFLGLVTPNRKINPLKNIVRTSTQPGRKTTYEKLLKDPRLVTTFDMKTFAQLTKVQSKNDHKTTKPVLVLVGQREENPNEIILAKKAVEALPNARLEVIERASHLLFIEEPVKTADRIGDWLVQKLM